MIPPSFNFKGDRQKSISLKAQARQFYNFVMSQAELGGIPFMSRTRYLPDGSVITVTTKKENIYGNRTGFITINTIPLLIEELEDGIYLESGFIDFISTGKCTEDAYKPGTLNYNAKVIAELNSLTPIQGKVKLKETDLLESPFTGELLVDGQESLSVGCKESARFPTITTPPPCDATFTSGGYCGLDLWIRKTCMQKVPASMYSGKLRLFIQAMYGSTRKDFSNDGSKLVLTDQSGARYTNPRDGSITLEHSGQFTSNWLITIGDGGYAICSFDGANIVMVPLLLTPIATKFAEVLASHPNKSDFSFYTKVEAYLLAYATPEYDSTKWIRIPVDAPIITGDPLSYGWHASWDGKEVHIVTFYKAVTADRFTSTRYSLEITQSVSGGIITFSAAVTQEETGKEWANWSTGINVFYYDDQAGQMMALAKPGSFIPATFTFNAPVYCVMQLNTSTGRSDLVVGRVFYNISGTPGQFSTVDTEGYSQYRYSLEDYAATSRLITYGTKSHGGVEIVSGTATIKYTGYNDSQVGGSSGDCVFVGGKRYGPVPIRPNNYFAAPGSWFDSYGWRSNGLLYEFFDRPKPGGAGTQFAFLWAEYSFLEVESYNRVGSERSFSAFLESVHLDCESMVFGVSQTRNNSAAETANRTFNALTPGSAYQVRDMGMMEAKFDPDVGTFVATGVWLHKASDTTSVYCQPMGGPSNPIGFYGSTPSGGSSYVRSPAGLDYATFVNEVVEGKTPETAIRTSSDGDTRYFHPVLSSPGTDTIDYVQASIQSGSYSNHTLYDSDYGFIKNASVGWA